MKYIFVLSLILFTSCQNNNDNTEYPFIVAKSYCDCLQKQMQSAKDSSVILTDCENSQFSKSRLMKIYSDFDNRYSYSQETLDSASKFSTQVFHIIDSLCYNKIDFKKVKKIPHIKM